MVEIVNKPDTGISCINVISSDRYERKFDNKYSSTSSRFRKEVKIQSTKRHFWGKSNDQANKEILDVI